MSRDRPLSELLEDIKLRYTDPQRQAVVAQLAADAVEMSIRHAAGEDVEGNLRHLASQALNLSREESNHLFSALNSWIGIATATALRSIFPAPQ